MDWRTQWAERENARRRAAYDSAISRWAQVDGELRSMARAARDFDGVPAQQVPGWLDLKRGERLLWLGSDAQLVVAPTWPALAQPGYANLTIDHLIGPFDHAMPVTLTAIDRGPVAVTDRRVVVAGRRHREWTYSKLYGLGHLPNVPCTLMHVSNRTKVSGLRLDPRAAAPFRFHLALGLADSAGDRAGFVAHLDRVLAWHQSIRPLPVAGVAAADAPSLAGFALGFLKTAVVGPAGASAGRRVAHLGATFVALLVLLALLTPDTPQTETLSAPSPSPSASSTPSPTPTPTPTPVEVKQNIIDVEPIPFETETVRDSSLDKGVREVRTRGVDGERTITYEVTYVDGKEAARRQVRSEVTKQPVMEVVAVGTKAKPKPKPKVEPEPEPEPNCHPSYAGECLAIVDDLDCADVDGEVQVVGPDVYRLDRDGDGTGCDS